MYRQMLLSRIISYASINHLIAEIKMKCLLKFFFHPKLNDDPTAMNKEYETVGKNRW